MKNQILEKIVSFAKECPDRVAIKYKTEQMTYKELLFTVEKISVSICELLGAVKKCPIIVCQERSINFLVTMLAVIKCSCYYIPVEMPVPQGRLLEIIEDSKAKIIIGDQNLDLKTIKNCICINVEKIICESNANRAIQNNCDCLQENDLIYSIYTSGTTGFPKGVLIKYKNIMNLIESFYDILYKSLDSPQNIAVVSSFSFDASVKQIFSSFWGGHTLIIAPTAAKCFGRVMNDFICENEIDIIDLTPTVLSNYISQKITGRKGRVNYCLIGGENLSWELLNDCISSKLSNKYFNLYGPTECCVDVSYKYIDKDQILKHKTGVVPIGRPLKNTELILLDPNNVIINEDNVKGEICVLGSQIGAGYTNEYVGGFCEKPFTNERMYRTGDIGEYTNGEIVLKGRLDSQVKIHGNRVDLKELENFLKIKFPLEQFIALILTIYDKKCLVLICILKNKEKSYKEKICFYLKKYFPVYMIPRYIICYEKIPINGNGKVNLKKIQKDIEEHRV